jgi:hypothetical protein
VCRGDRKTVDADEARETTDVRSRTERIERGYVPGWVLVVTSVSTLSFKSTTPSRLGGSDAPETIMSRLFPWAEPVGTIPGRGLSISEFDLVRGPEEGKAE